MKAWIARDEDGEIFLHLSKPYKLPEGWAPPYNDCISLGHTLFPAVKWEDEEPTEVEITIKQKKK